MVLYLAILLSAGSLSHENSIDKTRLKLFFQKVEILVDNVYPEGAIPHVYSPPPTEDNMPMVVDYQVDEATQLLYSLVKGKVYDPELGIGIDFHEGTLYDSKSGKSYSVEDLDLEGIR